MSNGKTFDVTEVGIYPKEISWFLRLATLVTQLRLHCPGHPWWYRYKLTAAEPLRLRDESERVSSNWVKQVQWPTVSLKNCNWMMLNFSLNQKHLRQFGFGSWFLDSIWMLSRTFERVQWSNDGTVHLMSIWLDGEFMDVSIHLSSRPNQDCDHWRAPIRSANHGITGSPSSRMELSSA